MRLFIKAFLVGALFGAASAIAAPLAFSDGADDPHIAGRLQSR